jgi:hypothetical protein
MFISCTHGRKVDPQLDGQKVKCVIALGHVFCPQQPIRRYAEQNLSPRLASQLVPPYTV